MLVLGSRGLDVMQLQKDLAAAGFSPGQTDGIFGPLTMKAVMELQRHCSLKVDGIAGNSTRLAASLLAEHKAQLGRQVSEHFKEEEFACRCCGMVKLNIHLVKMLEKLRSNLGGSPVFITSGYRCAEHNRQVGGVKNSQHPAGNAADVVVEGVTPKAVAEAALKLGFTGVGQYQTFTHADVRPDGPARW